MRKIACALMFFTASGAAHGGCLVADYAQYKDRAAGPDAIKVLAGDLCIIKIGFRTALRDDQSRATMSNPAYLKTSDACIAEMRKLTDAAKAAGIGKEVSDLSKTICPGA